MSQMCTSVYQWFQRLILKFFLAMLPILVVASGVALAVPDPRTKCGECPCANPCNDQQPPPQMLSPPPPPPPPSTMQYYGPPPPVLPEAPPPPRFVYVTGLPPPRVVYVTGPPGNNLYQNDPFNMAIFSCAARNLLTRFLLLVGYGILHLLVF